VRAWYRGASAGRGRRRRGSRSAGRSAPAAIGARVHLSPRAVERDISAVFTKLGLPATDEHNRRVLAVLAFLGLRLGGA